MTDRGGAPDVLTTSAFAIVVVIGAGNFLGVRVSNEELAPFWGAGLRFSLAAGAFVAIVLALRLPWPRGRTLVETALYGALGIGVFYALMYWALVRVTAGVATVVMATVPLVTLLLATAQGLERLRLRSVLGGLLALAGITWMAVGPGPFALPLDALAALLVAAVAVGQSIIFGKRVASAHPAVVNAVGMVAGAVLLFGASAAAGEPWVLPRRTATVVAVAYLVAVGSVAMFVLILLVVRRWTASATSYLFVLFPLATIVLERLLLGEPVTLRATTGAMIVIAGVWIGALRPDRSGSAGLPTPPPTAATPAVSAGDAGG